MYTIKAIYDGTQFKPMQPIPVKENYEVFITFVEPIKESQKNIMEFAGIWKDKDIIDLEQIMLERENFSSGRADSV